MIYIILPTYNEEKSIDPLFKKISEAMAEDKYNYKIIVVDDGSSDATPELLKKYSESMPMEIIRHRYNRGLGETIRDGFERASELCQPEDIIVRMDADNTHEPKYISEMIKKLDEGYDVVIASRFKRGGGQIGLNHYRSFITWAAAIFMKIFFPIKGIREYTCAFRAYRGKIIKRAMEFYGNNFIQLKGLGFTCSTEKLIKLKIIGAKFAEVPFVLMYSQKGSESKMVAGVTTFGYFTLLLLYYWPWGGWRRGYARKLSLRKE